MNVAIIQSRLGSTRLPKKSIAEIKGKTIIEHIVDRLRKCQMIGKIVIATTDKEEDKIYQSIFFDQPDILIFYGSEKNVLKRYCDSIRYFVMDSPRFKFVRITGDCPVIDPEIVDELICKHIKEENDLTSNAITETFPDGLDCEIFNYYAIMEAERKAVLKSDLEHVTLYIKNHSNIFKIGEMKSKINYHSKRWTVDNKEDLEFIKILYENLYDKNPCFGMNDILKYLKENPWQEKINSHIKRNEGLIKSLKEDLKEKRDKRIFKNKKDKK
jgi:spore coat polysaccharide biosynthesis protein SpsF